MKKKRGRTAASKRTRRSPQSRSARPRPRGRATPRSRRLAQRAAAAEIDAIRDHLAQVTAAGPPRWNASPDDVKRSVLKLVLTLVELIRQLLERQAIRRMERGTLTADETEGVGLALMRLQDTIVDLAKQFDIDPDELNLDLGPLGKLL